MKKKISIELEIPNDTELSTQEILKELSLIEHAFNQNHSNLKVELNLADEDLDEVGETLKVKKLTEDAIIPTRAYKTSLAYDLFSNFDMKILLEGARNLRMPVIAKVRTGIAMEFPKGYGGKIECRSSLGKLGVSILGGVIDEDYRGEIMVMLMIQSPELYPEIKKGDKIAQLILVQTPTFEIEEVSELSSTDRGDQGFGSSGK